jgi:hypothetical protein
MGRGQSKKRIIITMTSTAALLAAASYSYAQQGDEPGLRLTLGVGAGVSIDDNASLAANPGGSTTTADTTLRFGLTSETRTSRLAVSVPLRFEYRNDPGSNGEFELLVPNASISYSQQAANSAVSATASYAVRRLDDSVLTFVDIFFNPVDLIVDGGELRQFRANGTLSFGIEGPIGFDASAFIDDRNYTDTLDPDLYDRTRYGATGSLRLQFTDVLTGRVTASVEQFEADDFGSTEETELTLGTSATYDVDQVTAVTAGVSYTTIDRTRFGVTNTVEEGWGFSLGAVRDLPNGSISGSVARTVNTTGNRTAIRVGRAMELPRGALSYAVGYSLGEDGEDAIVADVAWRHDLPTGRITASLVQETTVDDDDQDTLVTRVALGYSQEVNSVSGFDVSFGLGRTDNLGSGPDDLTTRANLGVTYRREIARDVDWSVGYEARYLKEDGGDARNSNRVFTRIDRSFSIRP